jgi:hypothetical protein
MSWPNPAISTTTTEPDARLVNQDVDVGSNREDAPPGVVPFPVINPQPFHGLDWDAWWGDWTIPVSVAAGAPDTTRYLNVFADFSEDGSFWVPGAGPWCSNDWILRNRRVLNPPGTTVNYTFRSLWWPAWAARVKCRNIWTRQILSRDSLVWGDWRSVGTDHGETEDHVFHRPRPDTPPPDSIKRISSWVPRKVIVPPGGGMFKIKVHNRSRSDVWLHSINFTIHCPDPVVFNIPAMPIKLKRCQPVWIPIGVNWVNPGYENKHCYVEFELRTCFDSVPPGGVPRDWNGLPMTQFIWRDSVATSIPDSIGDEKLAGQTMQFGVTTDCFTAPPDSARCDAYNLPGGATFTPDTGHQVPLVGQFTWTPDFNSTGLYTVLFVSRTFFHDSTAGFIEVVDTLPVEIFGRNRLAYPVAYGDGGDTIGRPGDTVHMSFRVANYGDTVDSYSYQLSGPSGWDINPGSFGLTLSDLQDTIVEVTAVIAQGASPALYPVVVSAGSQGDGRLTSVDTAWVYVSAPGINEEGRPRNGPRFGLTVEPNPSRGAPDIHYSLVEDCKASMKLYDITGTLVRRLVDSYVRAGSYTTRVSLKLPRGVYVLRLQAAGSVATRMLVVD